MSVSDKMLKAAVEAYKRGKGNPVDDWMLIAIEDAIMAGTVCAICKRTVAVVENSEMKSEMG